MTGTESELQNVHDLWIKLKKTNDCIAGMQEEIRMHGAQIKDLQASELSQKSSHGKHREDIHKPETLVKCDKEDIQSLEVLVKSTRRRLKSTQQELLVAGDNARSGLELHKGTEELVSSLQQQLLSYEGRLVHLESWRTATTSTAGQSPSAPHTNLTSHNVSNVLHIQHSPMSILPVSLESGAVHSSGVSTVAGKNRSLVALASRLNAVATGCFASPQTGSAPSNVVNSWDSSNLNVKMSEEDCNALVAVVRPLLVRVEGLEMRLAAVDALEASARAFTSRSSALEEFSDLVDRLAGLENEIAKIKGTRFGTKETQSTKKVRGPKVMKNKTADKEEADDHQSIGSNPKSNDCASGCNPQAAPLSARLDSLRRRLGVQTSDVGGADRSGMIATSGELHCHDLFEAAIGQLTGSFHSLKASSEEMVRSLSCHTDGLERRLQILENKHTRLDVGGEEDIMCIVGQLMSRVMCVEGRITAAEQLRTAREGEITSRVEALESESWNSSSQTSASLVHGVEAAEGIWCRLPVPPLPLSTGKLNALQEDVPAVSSQVWRMFDDRITALEHSAARRPGSAPVTSRRPKIVITTTRKSNKE